MTTARRRIIRFGLGFLAAVQLLLAALAQLLPRTFYDNVPLPGHPWIALLPPFNEHLIRDYGSLSLSLVVVLGAALIWTEVRLVRTALVAYLAYAVPHLAFHILHPDGFPPVDFQLQTIALVVSVLVPTGLLAASSVSRTGRGSNDGRRTA